MQLSHTGSDEMLGKIKKSWGKLREVMGQFLHLIQKDSQHTVIKKSPRKHELSRARLCDK